MKPFPLLVGEEGNAAFFTDLLIFLCSEHSEMVSQVHVYVKHDTIPLCFYCNLQVLACQALFLGPF